jgi:hypothetical protein
MNKEKEYFLPSENPKEWIDNEYTANEWRSIIYALIEKDVGEIPENTLTYLSDCIKNHARAHNKELIQKLVEMTSIKNSLQDKIRTINEKIIKLKNKKRPGNTTRVYRNY